MKKMGSSETASDRKITVLDDSHERFELPAY